jgi:uncharacterized protein (DUF2141 family)
MFRKTITPLLFWLLGGLACAALWSSYGCASIGAPTGGARDSIGPVMIKALPENFTPNFKSKIITLNFDEYVDLDGVFEKLVINPPLEKFPLVERKLRAVTIKIKDTLEPNTTYSWRFDDIIKDANEGNPLGEYTYVFSTGPNFDSAKFAGRILDAETGKVDSTLIVILHNNLVDTAVSKFKPRYITKLDGKGFFKFNYLAPGNYNVFALKDDGMKRYSDSTQPFAFYDSVIQISDNTTAVEMLFFKAKEPAPEKKQADEVQKPKPKRNAEDGEVIEEKKKLKVALDQSSGAGHDIFSDITIKFSEAIRDIDSAKYILTDTLFKSVGTIVLEKDSTGKSLTLKHRWKLESFYNLQILAGAATDSVGNTLTANDTLRIKTKDEADYGAVRIDFAGIDFAQNPILQWYEGGRLYKSMPLTGATFTDKLFKPGEYEIRILLDQNKNGKWDTGDYWTKKQPERNLAVGKKLTIRPNWDNEFTIDMNAQEEEEK